MSKALIICYRDKNIPDDFLKRIEFIQSEILPDNIIPNDLDLVFEDGVISSIINPISLEQRHHTSICLGATDESFWWERKKDIRVLEGSYAIFRNDNNFVELQTDAVASRSIWYFCDDKKIIASNSQLAIIYYLESFQFNSDVMPWLLSSGSIGPYLSWDKRIQLLRPQSKLILDKETWEMNIKSEPINFTQNKDEGLNDEQLLEELSFNIKKATSTLPLTKKLLLPLSGGYDSRGVLLALGGKRKGISTITWGSKIAVQNKKNDAYIAKKLADHFQLEHNYVHSENSSLMPQTLIERFLVNSEGRIDHIGGYMDGFKIWEDIFKGQYAAIIRGDEGFGWATCFSEKQVRNSVGLSLIKDFDKLRSLDYKQIFPDDFEREDDETLEAWRDRLFHTFNLPMSSGSLNETKSAYVEVLNPLLSYSILKLVRTLPDRLRTNKKLFKLFVESESPNIPFATEGANIDYRSQLKNKEIVDYFIDTINSNQDILDKSFIQELITRVRGQEKAVPSSNFSKTLKRIMPQYLKNFLKAKVTNLIQLDDNLLLFRVFIIIRMNQKINNALQISSNENSNS